MRPAETVEDLALDDWLKLALGAEVPLGAGGLSALAEVSAAVGMLGDDALTGRTAAFEGIGGLRFRHRSGVIVSLVAGGGFTQAFGAPDLRGLLAVGWGNAGPAPPSDTDIAFAGRRPDAIPDTKPEAGSRPDAGASPVAPVTELTVPALDAAAFDAVAAADPDPDGDAVAGARDRCPHEPEDVDGFDDDDGCPDEGKGNVTVTRAQIEIDEKIHFSPGSAKVSPQSLPLLKQVASALEAAWWVRRLRVEGHTDDRGDKEMNVDLSERRAAAVVTILVGEGIAAHRLEAKGYGPTKPVADNASSGGRARNRRVVFRITKVAPTK